jgi:hypothetical protein
MAFLADARLHARDANGDPLVGATLTIRNAGTMTLSSVYRDADLTDAMSNPTSGADVSDAGGWFPQIFAADGSTFDITLKDANGVTVKSYVDVPVVGEGAGAFIRDFGSSRVSIDNSGGTIRLAAGNAAGDDVGGNLSLGGWNNTQADAITLDGAATNTTGKLTVGGKKLPGVVVSETAFSAQSTVVVAVPNDPAGVTAFDIEFFNITSSGASTLDCTFSYDNGATYASTGYGGGSLAAGMGGNATTLRLRLITAASGLNHSAIFGTAVQPGAATPLTTVCRSHVGGGGENRVTHVKFVPNAGTLTGKYRVVPVYGSGDA